jgi:hypothetical protein
MPDAHLPTPAPVVNPESQRFWEATASGTFLIRRCNACGAAIWYPRQICPECHSLDTNWVEASGRGVIYSFTIVRRGDGPYKDAAPYVVAYVELEEGPRVLTNIVADPETVEVGQPVTVVFHDTGSGSALPRFRLA